MGKFVGVVGILLLLGGCDLRVGKNGDSQAADANAATQAAGAPAAGKAEEGELSIKVPGFDMKVNIPKQVAERASADSDSELVYPGSSIGGLHIGADGARSGVELSFKSSDPLDKVDAWYRDPARKDGFSISSEQRQSGSVTISGTQKQDGDPFRLQLSAAPGGGTEGRLTLTERR